MGVCPQPCRLGLRQQEVSIETYRRVFVWRGGELFTGRQKDFPIRRRVVQSDHRLLAAEEDVQDFVAVRCGWIFFDQRLDLTDHAPDGEFFSG